MQPGSIEQKVDDLGSELRAHLLWHERQEDMLQAILEYVRDIPEMKADIRQLKDDMHDVKFDVELLKADMKEVRGRLDRLETAG